MRLAKLLIVLAVAAIAGVSIIGSASAGTTANVSPMCIDPSGGPGPCP